MAGMETFNSILITGGNKGIGRAIALHLAQQGHEVVIVVRDREKGKAAEELRRVTRNDKVYFIQGDLSSIAGCIELTEIIKTAHPDINVLINNAGVWMTKMQLNEDGFEQSFMVNCLAPFILTTELLEQLKTNSPARIVNINAGLYENGQLDLDKTPYGKEIHKIKTYANSKLCNAMFTIDLSNQLKGTGVTINAVHPGVVRTDMGTFKGLPGLLFRLVKRFWKAPEQGATALVWLVTDEELKDVNGRYFNEKTEVVYSAKVLNGSLRKKLWDSTILWIQNKKLTK